VLGCKGAYMKISFGICIGIVIGWLVWNAEFHFKVEETGIMHVLGRTYHVIPWEGNTP